MQEEDTDDFAHLASDNVDMEEENDENEAPETVSTREVHERLREIARRQKSEERVGSSHLFAACFLGPHAGQFSINHLLRVVSSGQILSERVMMNLT